MSDLPPPPSPRGPPRGPPGGPPRGPPGGPPRGPPGGSPPPGANGPPRGPPRGPPSGPPGGPPRGPPRGPPSGALSGGPPRGPPSGPPGGPPRGPPSGPPSGGPPRGPPGAGPPRGPPSGPPSGGPPRGPPGAGPPRGPPGGPPRGPPRGPSITPPPGRGPPGRGPPPPPGTQSPTPRGPPSSSPPPRGPPRGPPIKSPPPSPVPGRGLPPPPPGPSPTPTSSSSTTMPPTLGPPAGAPKLSFLDSIAGGAKLKKVNAEDSGGGGVEKTTPSPPAGRSNLLSDISGGAARLKRRETAPPPSAGGGSMLDAIAAQKNKMAEKRASVATPPARNTPSPRNEGGGFNTNMLQRAQLKTHQEEKPDSDSDDWSDDENDKEKEISQKVAEALKPPPARQNSNLTAAVSKPPAIVKPPPSRPKDNSLVKKDTMEKPVNSIESRDAISTSVVEKNTNVDQGNVDDDDEKIPPPPPMKSESESLTGDVKSTDLKNEQHSATQDIQTDPATEIAELKKKLENAEAKLKEGGTQSSILLRESVLEEQLERAHASIVTLKHDKNALKLSIRELQTRLTNAQVHKKNGGDEVKAQTAASVQEAMQRGEREKDLEKQLIKAKKDKDKALKLLIQLIGKERIAEHLQKHAGEGDILDSLVAHFAGTLNNGTGDGSNISPSHNSSSSKKKRILGATKGNVGTMGRPAFRSRSDQYFHEVQY